MAQIASPFPQFFDLDGKALEGTVYVGVVGQNPKTNLLAIYWDDALTLPAVQPLQVAGGLVMRQGAPARVWSNADDYSISVYNRKEILVYYEASGTMVNSLRADLASSSGSSMIGFLHNAVGAVPTTDQAKLRRFLDLKEDFGAVGNGIADDSDEIVAGMTAAAALKMPLRISDGVYKYSKTAAQVFSDFVAIEAEGNAKIIFAASIDDFAFRFNGGCKITGLTFDGNGGYFCSTNGLNNAVIKVSGASGWLERCVFENIDGIQDRYQYAVYLDHNTLTTTRDCTFSNITVATDSTNTGGFCGGIWLANDALNPTNIVASNHLIENCRFEEIYTRPNNLGQLYPDSDAIRVYTFGDSSVTLGNAAKNTNLVIRDCYFKNVLKSGVKSQIINTLVEGCEVYVDNPRTQTEVSYGFRYQTGVKVTYRDNVVRGEKILYGVVAYAHDSMVDNLTFSSTHTGQSCAVVVGQGIDDGFDLCSVQNIYVDSADCILGVSSSSTIRASNLFSNRGNLRSAVVLFFSATDVVLDNVYINAVDESYGQVKTYKRPELVKPGSGGNGSETLYNLTVNNSKFYTDAYTWVNDETCYSIETITLNNVILEGKIDHAFYLNNKMKKLVINNSRLITNGQTSNAYYSLIRALKCDDVVIRGSYVGSSNDLAATPVVYIGTSTKNVSISDCEFESIPTAINKSKYFIYAVGNGTGQGMLDNCRFKDTNTNEGTANTIAQLGGFKGAKMSNLHLLCYKAQLSLSGNSGWTLATDCIGTFAAIPVYTNSPAIHTSDNVITF